MTTTLKARLRRSALAVMCAALTMSAGQTMQAQDALPKGVDLLAKSVAASGGAEAMKAIKFIHAKGTFEMPAQNITGSVDLTQGRPSLMRMLINIQGIGEADNGCDGKIAWSLDPINGPSLLTGKALAEQKADALFDGMLFGPDYVKSATTIEKSKFGEHPAYKVKVVTTFDTERTLYIDAESYLIIGAEALNETPQGAIPTTTTMGDFKKFGALLQPTTIVQSGMGMEQIIRLTSVEYDNVPATAFEPPAAIKALIK